MKYIIYKSIQKFVTLIMVIVFALIFPETDLQIELIGHSLEMYTPVNMWLHN